MKSKRKHRRRIDLLRDVPAYKHGSQFGPKRKSDSNIDGESVWILLRRFQHERCLRGRLWNTCCRCGMEHLYSFEVVAEADGTWWLIKRGYVTPGREGKYRKRRSK